MGCTSAKNTQPPPAPQAPPVKDPPIAEQFKTMLASSTRPDEISLDQYLQCPHTVSRMKTKLVDLQEMREFFYEFDENHDGFVDQKAFLQTIVKMDMELVKKKMALNAQNAQK